MRLPRVRLRVRTLLILVAAVAVLLGAVLRRRDHFRKLAARHAIESSHQRAIAYNTELENLDALAMAARELVPKEALMKRYRAKVAQAQRRAA
jgi:hypothetical protein